MKSFDKSIKINHNPNWPYRILIIGGSGSGKDNALLNVIKHQRPDISKIYFYLKHWFESKYQLLIKGRTKMSD